MIVSKIPVPQDTWLVEIITDKNDRTSHAVYFINDNGNLVDYLIVRDANAMEVINKIPHIMKIHFTSDITESIPNISSVFNRLDKNQEVRYDYVFSWQLNSHVVPVIREYCKMVHVHDYVNTVEFKEKAHRLDDFISQGNKLEILDIIQQAVV